mmetsp:Transcript_53732/g.69007  ORF Transcript_53732/g.69007 Transcript_53732/m.69007 type:complete len:348 (-) Transcript_53732:171-1214(-)
MEFEQVVSKLLKLAPFGTRCIAYSRSGLGISDATSPPSFLTLLYAALKSSSYSTLMEPHIPSQTLASNIRSSSALSVDLKQLFEAMQVSGPVVMVASGSGALHSRVFSQQLEQIGCHCEGLVFIEPIVEGVAAEHALINPAIGQDARWFASCLNACFSQFGFLRFAAWVSSTAQKRANGLYGASCGDAVLRYNSRTSHAFTGVSELEAWDLCEREAAESALMSRDHSPALILTRGRSGVLFQGMPGSTEMEVAWDNGLVRLTEKLASGHFDVCIAALEEGGLRMPLYRPEAVAAAITMVLRASERGHREGHDSLSDVIASTASTFKDMDASEGVVRLNVLQQTLKTK